MNSDSNPASTNEPTDALSMCLLEADRELSACLGAPCPATAEAIFSATAKRLEVGDLSPAAMVMLVASAMSRITFEAVALREKLDAEQVGRDVAYALDANVEQASHDPEYALEDDAPGYRTLLLLESGEFD